MSVAATLLAGVVFGLAMAAPPGPQNAIIAEESVLRGWGAGFRAGLGAMTGDVILCGLALVGVVTVVAEVPALRTAMVGIGGLLMCWFAVGAYRSARDSFVGDEVDSDPVGFRKTVVLSLTNPYQVVFWMTVGIGLLQPGRIDLVDVVPGMEDAMAALGGSSSVVIETGSVALLVGFFGGIAIWVTAYPAALVAAGNRIDRAAPVIAAGSALVLAGFGVVFLADAALAVL